MAQQWCCMLRPALGLPLCTAEMKTLPQPYTLFYLDLNASLTIPASTQQLTCCVDTPATMSACSLGTASLSKTTAILASMAFVDQLDHVPDPGPIRKCMPHSEP